MLISDWSSDVCSSYLRTGDAGSFELRPGAVDPLAACGRTPGGRVLDMVLMVAANEDDIDPAGGIVEPPARYEIILEAAIEEVAAEDVEDIVFDAIGQRRGGIEQRVKGALKITDVNDAAVAGEDLGLGVPHEELHDLDLGRDGVVNVVHIGDGDVRREVGVPTFLIDAHDRMLTDAAALRPFLIGSEHLMRARVVEVDDHHGIVVVTRERHDRLDVLGGRERCFEDDGLAGCHTALQRLLGHLPDEDIVLLGDGHHPVDVDRVAGHDFANLVEGEVMTFEAEAPNEAALATALWSANDDDILHGVSCLVIRFDVLSRPADQRWNWPA